MTAPVDIRGQKFNRLTAIEPTDNRNSEGIVWRCLCDCGTECFVSAKSLRNGNTKSCGCAKRKDIGGQKFGRLTALHPTQKRYQDSVIWHCICDCGNEIDVMIRSLTKGNTKSCGCLPKDTAPENSRNCADRIDGTKAASLTAKKPATNTSGIKGVSWSKQKQDWEAYIKFKGHLYHLGHFEKLEDAGKARARAEENFYGNFLEWYAEYKRQLKED